MTFADRLPRRTAHSLLRDLEPEVPLAGRLLALSHEAATHDVFRALNTIDDIQIFMAHHVWAVWDFMSLLKSIQAEVAPVRVPWWPPADAAAARFINEIAAGEEGDDGPHGVPESHFGIYLEAMRECGADLGPVRRFMFAADRGFAWWHALEIARPPAAAASFVRSTLRVCQRPLCERVAAFTLGREELIPSMFQPIIAHLKSTSGGDRSLRSFTWYLERHLVVDEGHHGPLAAALLEHTCLQTPSDRDAAFRAAEAALEERLRLWDATLQAIRVNTGSVRSVG